MKSILPIIIVILLLLGAIAYSLTKATLPRLIPKQEGVPANELEISSIVTPTPTVTPTLAISSKNNSTKQVTPTAIPTIISKKTATEKTESAPSTTKGGQKVTQKVTNSTICTPVYGMANTCTEHVVVDTAGESSLFFNFAGLSYLAGLVAFIKGKQA